MGTPPEMRSGDGGEEGVGDALLACEGEPILGAHLLAVAVEAIMVEQPLASVLAHKEANTQRLGAQHIRIEVGELIGHEPID